MANEIHVGDRIFFTYAYDTYESEILEVSYDRKMFRARFGPWKRGIFDWFNPGQWVPNDGRVNVLKCAAHDKLEKEYAFAAAPSVEQKGSEK